VVDPSLYYFRVTMQFETSDPKYQYLNRYIGIAFAMRLGNAVIYDAYLVNDLPKIAWLNASPPIRVVLVLPLATAVGQCTPYYRAGRR
jgi:hypothetical protein